ncbi:MAG: ThuA domain-containing protein, partial [Planctomycetaceae bacterium]
LVEGPKPMISNPNLFNNSTAELTESRSSGVVSILSGSRSSWLRGCRSAGLPPVPLYEGTKHSGATAMMERSGLKVVDAWGGFDGSDYTMHSRRMIVMAEKEYRTNETLPKFAVAQLGKHFSIQFVHADAKDRNNVPGIEVVRNADVLFVSVRRRILPRKQLAVIRRHVAAGKPIVGIRTASHAFCLRKSNKTPKGHDAWPEFDAEVWGGSYTNHHGNTFHPSVRVADGAEAHPILSGVKLDGFVSGGSLYKVRPLGKATRRLLIGAIKNAPAEPVAWTNKPKTGNRAFYTSLGQIKDFKSPEFNKFLRNAVYWAAGVKVSDTVRPGY